MKNGNKLINDNKSLNKDIYCFVLINLVKLRR